MLKQLDKADYLEILRIGLLNVRGLASNGDASGCFVEADHLHNLPYIISSEDPGAESYYWNAERESYLRQASPKRAASFAEVWSQRRS